MQRVHAADLTPDASAMQGLGFQIWPAALLMCQYLEHKDVASPGCWKVCAYDMLAI